MILQIIAKAVLIITYILLLSVISLGMFSIGLFMMSQTDSVMGHWIIAFISVTPIGLMLWFMQDVIEYIVTVSYTHLTLPTMDSV